MPIGTVVEWDDPRGFGVIRTDHGDRLFFHCTDITDGTRTIEAGTRVAFGVRPGHRGQWEAEEVTTL